MRLFFLWLGIVVSFLFINATVLVHAEEDAGAPLGTDRGVGTVDSPKTTDRDVGTVGGIGDAGSDFERSGFPSSGGGSAPGMSVSLNNPLRANNITEFLMGIIEVILVFAIPLIVFFIMLNGFKYVTAQGNTEQIKQATVGLTWAIIGGVLILGAKILIDVIQNTVNALR